jgi:hypothetical protein
MTVAGLMLGIVGILIGLYFGLYPRSPEPVIGKPVSTKGGRNPVPLFHGKSFTRVHETELILFSIQAAIKYASELKDNSPIVLLGSARNINYCASSYAMPRAGVYRCVIQSNGINTIADPCFGIDKGDVECQIPNGIIGLVNVSNLANIRTYHPSLSEVGKHYPFRLTLDNGMICTWNWLAFRGHTGGGWICTNPLRAIELEPVRYHQFLTGRDALGYNGALVRGTNYMYYAEDLAQGNQSTWSILLESPNNLGVFHRVSVEQAWY